MSDKEFVSGLFVKEPHPKAPDFVKCGISLKREELITWLQGKQDEYINLQVKSAKSGKWYAEVDNWKPDAPSNPQANTQSTAPQADFNDELPPFM